MHFVHSTACNEGTRDIVVNELMCYVRAALIPADSFNNCTNGIGSLPRHRLQLTELPEDIYRYIQAFVPINAMLNTSKRLADCKRRLFYWKLNRQYSLLYYHSAEFRDCLKSGGFIHDTRKQVALDYTYGRATEIHVELEGEKIRAIRPLVHFIHF